MVFSEVRSKCNSCHRDVHQNTVSPDCRSCHSTETWLIADVNSMHQRTRFPLVGVHQNLDCASCHTQYSRLYFPPIDVACVTCHSKEYYSTTQPNHVQAQFSTQCQTCHNVIDVSWGPTSFTHDFFPLVAGHAIPNCFACHQQGNNKFSGLSTDCYSCHKNDFQRVTFPNHVIGGFSTNCATCHTINGWSPAPFNHTTTGFTLTGAHATIACGKCHVNPTATLSTSCYTCHSADFASATDPNHVSGRFSHTCDQCHSTTNWGGASFDHSTTGFPLTGEHANLQCAQCHASGYTNTPSDCYSCHSRDYMNAVTPVNHVAIGLQHTCQDCHTTMALFTTTTFDHSTTTFPLTGLHVSVSCQSCHKGSVTTTATDCYSCHSADYANAVMPVNHSSAGIEHTCQDCHTTTAQFTTTTFVHPAAPFQLTGAHTTLACQSCHTGSLSAAPTDCYSCHTNDFNSTTNPNHVQQGFSHTCTNCHSTTDWNAASFDHTAAGFPLTGEHANLQCAQCHASGYTATPTGCYSCHSTDYVNATSPVNHSAAGIEHTCQDCHTISSPFTTTTFVHPTSPFQLTGAHTTVPCQSCHTGTLSSAPTDCYSCHTTDYNTTSNPPHASAGYPTACASCHTTTAWSPSTFNHTQFPITSGNHASPPLLCSQCHTTVSNFAIFSCTTSGCHSQASTDPRHTDVRNYVYSPTSCYSCHPTGRTD